MIHRVTVCGLGKLGLPMAAVFASHGYTVTGYDSNKEHIESILKGQHGIKEPQLDSLLKDYKSSIHFTHEPLKAFKRTDAIFIIVPTPSHKDGYFMNNHLFQACREIGKNIGQQRTYYLVVVVSTVMPGTMVQVKKIMEDNSGMECGKGFGLCYNPEFVALGSVVENMYKPDSYLIGESDDKAGQMLAIFLQSIPSNMPTIHRMDFMNAEVAKLLLNSYLTMKISFANYTEQLCGKYPLGNVDIITKFLGADSRVGTKFLKGGTGFGGPCFPRDNVALTYFSRSIGVASDLQEATVITNINTNIEIVDTICDNIKNGGTIAILGVSYKPNSPVVDESSSIEIARMLYERGYTVRIHDPMAIENAKKVLNDKAMYFNSIEECLKGVGNVVLATPWNTYKDILSLLKDKRLFDCWRFFDARKAMELGVEYYAVGVSNTIPL